MREMAAKIVVWNSFLLLSLTSFCLAQDKTIEDAFGHPSKFIRGDFVQVIFQARYDGKTEVVEPKGEFATIDVAQSNQVIEQLLSPDKVQRTQAMERFLKEAPHMTPPVFFVAAKEFLESGEPDEAIHWLIIGRLRAGSDILKSLDPSVHQAIALLNHQFGMQIEQQFLRYASFSKIIERAFAWEHDQPRHYDARWIALYGDDAYSRSEVRFKDPEEWAKINISLRQSTKRALMDWVEGCREADRNQDGWLNEEETRLLVEPPVEVSREVRIKSMCDDVLFDHITNGAAGIRMLDRVNFPQARDRRVVDIEVVIPPGGDRNAIERWTVAREGGGTCYYTVTLIPDEMGGTRIITSIECRPIPEK
jgi:hypothetical protein